MAPVYLQTGTSQEEVAGMKASLLESLACLDELAETFDMQSPNWRSLMWEGSSVKSVYSAEALLTLILDADLLRNQQNLHQNLQFAIAATAPALVKESMLGLLQQRWVVPGESYVRKARICADLSHATLAHGQPTNQACKSHACVLSMFRLKCVIVLQWSMSGLKR